MSGNSVISQGIFKLSINNNEKFRSFKSKEKIHKKVRKKSGNFEITPCMVKHKELGRVLKTKLSFSIFYQVCVYKRMFGRMCKILYR